MSEALQVFAMQFLQSIIEIAVPILTTAAIALLYQAARFVRSKLKAEQLAQIDALVAVAVKAAEQSGLIGAISNVAADKKAWAIQEAQRLLNERGLKGISVATLDSMIEAQIRDGVHKGAGLAIAVKLPPDASPDADTQPFPPMSGSLPHR